MYVQIDSKNIVLGYSSNQMLDNDIEIEDDLLDKIFERCPLFYIYNSDANTFEYSEELYVEYQNNKNNIKDDKDILLEEVSKTKIALMQQKDINKNILKEASENKIAVMQQQEINKNLITEIANLKVINMKGSN
ncbi:MAG: hypothetical protein ACRC1T_17000 [Clostridium chrysemydis]|uniref:hypothetical protein n=1 Tax=Clostridium chrysemydis TaxID=2665504 RepID=UPI003F382F64